MTEKLRLERSTFEPAFDGLSLSFTSALTTPGPGTLSVMWMIDRDPATLLEVIDRLHEGLYDWVFEQTLGRSFAPHTTTPSLGRTLNCGERQTQ